MLLDGRSETVVSSYGWVEKGSLWVFSRRENTVKTFKIGSAKYLNLKKGTGDNFVAVHHFDAQQLDLTVHSFSDPGSTISRISITASAENRPIIVTEGDSKIWASLPGFYTAYAFGTFHLFKVGPNGQVTMEAFDWYDDSYDKGYQGIIDVIEVAPNRIIVSVQRDSNPILYDYDRKSVIRKLDLAGRRGNPVFEVRLGYELWTVDYDTVLRLDGKTLEVMKSAQMQGEASGVIRQFVGSLSLSDKSVTLARPFSRDVVLLDPHSLKVTHSAKLDGQPLSAAVFPDGAVVARDWKSGSLIQGDLDKKKWWSL